MYRGFRRSRIVMGVTLALTVALTVFVWMRNRGRAVYIPVLASVLLLGIGCTAARLLELQWWNWPVEKIRANLPRIMQGEIDKLG